jgi:hypothetical protein
VAMPSVTDIADIATALGIVVAAWTLRQKQEIQQVQLLDSTFQKINQLETEFYRAKRDGASPDDVMQWRSLFLNSLEFFAFLVNNKHLSSRFAIFFTPAVKHWYDTIFVPLQTPHEKNDFESYRELRKLYREIKEGRFRKLTG